MKLVRWSGVMMAVVLAVSSARAQCPTDFFPYFTDRPDDLAPGNNVVFGAFDVPALIQFDPDGTGPLAPIFIAAIHYVGPADCANQFTISSEWTRLDRYDAGTETWVPISPRFDGVVTCMTTFDEDNTGVNPPRLYIGGRFSGWSGINSPNIMRYDGASFSAVRNGLNGTVWCMRVHDDDGVGATLPKLYIGGEFTAAAASAVQGQVDCGKLIRLTGGLRWENPPSGFNDTVFALASFDEDGPGPGIAKLAAGGAFTSAGAVTARLVAQFDGTTWSSFGNGLDPMETWPTPNRRVFSLCEFDEDGSGPQLPSLFAGGTIHRSFDGAVSPQVIRWRKNYVTGNAGWLSVPSPLGLITSPNPEYCLNYCTIYPYQPNKPCVRCMVPFDLDGTGSGVTELYIGGVVYGFNAGGNAWGLMKWDPTTNTTSWVRGDSGTAYGNSPSPWSAGNYQVSPMAMITVPGNASVPGRLLIGGGRIETDPPLHPLSDPPAQGCPYGPITIATTISGTPIEAWGIAGAGPAVTNQPDNAWTTLPGSTSAGFNINLSGTAPFTYRWRKDGVDLVNGTSQGFGGIIGSTGLAVILGGTANPVNLTSQGWYDCRVGNACGTGYTTAAWLVVQPDTTPYFPIRFDSPVAPVTTAIGNADMRYIYTGAPYPRFFTYVAGTPFAIAPTGNNAWRGQLAAGTATGNRSVTIPTSRYGVGEVYTLLNTDGASSTNVRFSFNATGGLVYTTTLTGGNSIRSYTKFYGPQTVTSEDTTNVFDSSLMQMDKQRILLPNSFRLQTLTSITITDLGTDSTGRAILAGLTLRQRPPACGPADLGGVGGQRGADGVLDNNDFIVFIDLYFNGDLTADVGTTGGVPGADGVLDNNDFIVYINQFFNGC